MKPHIWRLATVGLLCVSISGQVLAEEQRGEESPQHARPGNGQPHGQQGQGGNNQPRQEHNQGRPQGNPGNQPRPEHNQPNFGNQPRPEHNQPNPGNQPRPEHNQPQGGQWQSRPHQEPNGPGRPAQPGNNLPIQPRPDAVHQNQGPNHGGNQNWQGGGHDSRPGNNFGPGNSHPNDHRWAGRPSGHGNGWGPGPQYRPGYIVDRFPGQHWQVPYRGQNYFFSGGYWYRPQGPRYIVVQPPYGIRVGYLPDYAQELWVGSTLMFLAAGAYYQYQPATQDYIVVQPPVAQQQPVSNGYDVVAYPANGQSPAQIDQDRYDCYRWAVDQSGFDPAKVTYAPSPAVVQTYRQAQGNCLSSRGYQVNY